VRIPPGLFEIARRQHGVLTLDDALATGLTKSALHRRLAAGLLERVGTHCLRVPGHPVTWQQELQVGLLDLGEGAVVGGRAAACLLGLDGFGPGPLEFLVPRSGRDRRTIGTVRSVAALPLIDRVMVEDTPCVSAARAIVDLAGRATERELENAVDSSLRLGWTSEPFLRKRLAALRHRGRPGVGLLDRVLDGAGGHSRLERMFLELVREADLPAPTCQQIHRKNGRFIARTDFTWEPWKAVAEVNGHATHSTRQQRRRDAQRHAELTVIGWRVLPFTYDQVTQERDWVVGILRELLAERERRQ
jgi:very-short-patch-repair endonuclease